MWPEVLETAGPSSCVPSKAAEVSFSGPNNLTYAFCSIWLPPLNWRDANSSLETLLHLLHSVAGPSSLTSVAEINPNERLLRKADIGCRPHVFNSGTSRAATEVFASKTFLDRGERTKVKRGLNPYPLSDACSHSTHPDGLPGPRHGGVHEDLPSASWRSNRKVADSVESTLLRIGGLPKKSIFLRRRYPGWPSVG